MKLTGLSGTLGFKAHKFALLWAKENLPEEKYQEICKSYHAILKWTAIFILVCWLPIIITFSSLVFNSPISKRTEAENTPENATSYVLARVDYDGNFYWTHDSQKYEYPLKNYSLSPNEYEFGDNVKVFLDDAQNIVEVTAVEKGFTVREMEVLIGVLGGILVPVLLMLCIHVPIAYHTYGKPWRMFAREFDER